MADKNISFVKWKHSIKDAEDIGVLKVIKNSGFEVIIFAYIALSSTDLT